MSRPPPRRPGPPTAATGPERLLDADTDPQVFWADIQRYFFHHQTYERGEGEAAKVMELIGAGPGAAVLDLCCGPGRVAVELAAAGADVTGVDLARPLLDAAADRAARRGVDVELVCADAREFCRDGAFDAVVNLWTSFGYGPEPQDDARILANVHRSLRGGGAFVLETLGKEGVARRRPPRLWSEHDEGFVLAQEIVVEPGWDRISHRWIVIEGDDRREYRLTHRLYSAAELRALLRATGFGTVEVYGDLDGRPYGGTGRLVTLARP